MSKFLPTLFGTTAAALAIGGAGLWFAPNPPAHGQQNEDQVQLADVTVVDDEGDQVVGAPITIQRLDSDMGRWVNSRGGGASDSSGQRTIEMPTQQGSYRVVLTVPNGYTEWKDDADGANPGPNSECAGMVARCVAYQVDALGSVSLMQPRRGADAMAITFSVTDNTPEPRLTVTQLDLNGRAVPGGQVTLHPYTIVRVGDQNVRQWGRAVTTEMTTANRTFRLAANTQYEVSWRPPANYIRVTPGAPFIHDVASPAKGVVSKEFRVTLPVGNGDQPRPGIAPGGSDESVPGGALQTPSGSPQPVESTPDRAPHPEPSQPRPNGSTSTPAPAEPTGSVSQAPTPAQPAQPVIVTAPTQPVAVAVPAQSTETVPTETVPAETVPAETVPTETVAQDPAGSVVGPPVVPAEPTAPAEPVEVEVAVTDPDIDAELLNELAAADPGVAAELAAELDPELAAAIAEEAGIEAAG